MSEWPSEWFSANFGGVAFGCGESQQRKDEENVVETLCPSADGQQPSTVFRDHLGRKPPILPLTMLVENGQQYQNLIDQIGYPPRALSTPQGEYTAELDSLTGGDRWLDVPQVVQGTFTILSETPTVAPTPPPRAGFVWAATGLLIELDANQGDPATWAFDGVIQQVDIEFGDGGTASMVGPFGVGGVPSAFHEYAGAGDYVVTISVVGSDSQRSADNSQLVTVV